jgi:hypothetical protein
MPSTMAAADRAVEVTKPIVQDITECGMSVASAAIASKALNKPTGRDVAAAATMGSSAGRVASDAIGAVIDKLFPLVARSFGAHECDNCGKADLYTYFKASHVSSSPGTQDKPSAAPAEGPLDHDLCKACHDLLLRGDASMARWASYRWSEHDNTLATLKLFLGALVALAVLKRLWMLVTGQ